MLKKVIDKLYNSPIIEKIVPTLVSCLKRSLQDCDSVLDVGCGPSSPLARCKNIKYSVGLEPFADYIKSARKKRIHSKYINSKVEDADFPEKSFDAVILIDVIEHMDKKEVYKLLKRAEKWARKKVILTTPNGFISQPELDGNPMQKHLSGWNYSDLTKLGFRLNGLAGLKCLRKEKEVEDSMDGDLTVSIKFKPKLFWFGIAVISQIYTYRFPHTAFEFFCVKGLAQS